MNFTREHRQLEEVIKHILNHIVTLRSVTRQHAGPLDEDIATAIRNLEKAKGSLHRCLDRVGA